MTSKKTAASKRAPLPRASDYTKVFLKDWERLSRSGRYDMNRLKEAMMLIVANDAPLGAEWKDHELTGDWSAHRECHIGGDFLLIYRIDDSGNIAVSSYVEQKDEREAVDIRVLNAIVADLEGEQA